MIDKDNFHMEDFLSSRERVKIFGLIAVNQELSLSQIVKASRLDRSSVKSHLNHLISLDLIQEKVFGRIKIYRYRIENVRARGIKKLIEIWEGDQEYKINGIETPK